MGRAEHLPPDTQRYRAGFSGGAHAVSCVREIEFSCYSSRVLPCPPDTPAGEAQGHGAGAARRPGALTSQERLGGSGKVAGREASTLPNGGVGRRLSEAPSWPP